VYRYVACSERYPDTLLRSKPRANARLRKLYDGRFLERADLPEATATGHCRDYPGLPAGTCWYPVIASRLAKTRHHPPEIAPWDTDLSAHSLEIVRFRLALEDALRADLSNSVPFLPSVMCRHTYEVGDR